MVDTKLTNEVTLDTRLKAGKVLNANTFLGVLAKQIGAMQLPTSVINPKIVFDLDEKATGQELRKLSTSIERVIQDPDSPLQRKYRKSLSPVRGESPSAFKTRMITMQETVGAIERFNALQQTTDLTPFQDKKFEGVLAASRKGVDIEKTFGPKAAAKLKNYLSLLEQVNVQIKKVETSLLSARGVTTDAFTVGAGDTERRIAGKSGKTPVLAPDLRTVSRDLTADIKEMRRGVDEPALAKRRAEARRAYAKEQQTALREQEAILARISKRNDVERARRESLSQKRLAQRAELSQAKLGRTALSKGAGIGGLAPTQLLGVQTDLNRKLSTYDKLIKRVTKRSPDSVARQSRLGKLNREAARLNTRLDATKLRLRELRGQETQHALDRGVGFGFTEKRGGLAKVGDRIIEERGGISRAGAAPVGELEFVQASLQRTVAKGRIELQKMAATGDTSSKSFKSLSKQVGIADQQLGQVTRRMKGFGTAAQQTGQLFRQFFRYAIGYGVLYQMLAAIRAVISGVVDLNKSLKSIQAVTGTTLENMKSIEVGIKSVALSTKFSVNEIADAGRILSQAGVKPEDFTSVLSSVATFAAATESSIENAADLVSTMRNVYTELNDTTIANQLTKAINISKLTAEDLKTILSRAAQVAKSYNLTADQFLAAVTVLRNAGIKASTVATGLRQGLIELLSPDQKTIAVLKQRYAELGESISEAAIKSRFFAFTQESNPLLSVLREFQRLGFTGAAEQQFQRVFDIRAMNTISAMIDNIDQLQDASTKLTFGNTSLQASQTQMEALANSMSNLGAAITVLSDQMAGDLVESLDGVVDKATEAVQALAKLDAQLKATGGKGIGLATLTGVAGGALVAATGSRKGAVAGTAKFGGGLALGTAGGVLGQQAAEAAGLGEKLSGVLSLIGSILVPLLAFDGLRSLSGIATKIPKFSKDMKVGAKHIGVVGGFFRAVSRLFGKIPAVLKKLPLGLTALRGFAVSNPITAGIAALVTVIYTASKILGKGTIEESKRRMDQAIQNFDAALAERNKLLEEFDEFRLSAGDRAVSPGTTAATVEGLRDDVNDLDAQLADTFKVSQTSIRQVREVLIRLNKEGFEAKSDIRKAIIEDLENIRDLKIEGISDADLSKISALAADQQDSANALQESVREQIVQIINVQGEMTLSQQAVLDSFRTLSNESDDTYNKLVGLVEATPQEVADLQVRLLNGITNFLRTSEIARGTLDEINAAAQQEIDAFADRLNHANTPEEVRELVLSLNQSLLKLGKGTTDYISDIVDALGKDLSEEARERVSGKPITPISKLKNVFGQFEGEEPADADERAKRTVGELIANISVAEEKLIPVNERLAELESQKASGASLPSGFQGVFDIFKGKQERLEEVIEKNTNKLDAAEQINASAVLATIRLTEQNERTRKAVEAQREAAIKIFNSPAFQAEEKGLSKSAKLEIAAVRKGGEGLLTDEFEGDRETGAQIVAPAASGGLKIADDFVKRQIREELGKVFEPNRRLAARIRRLTDQVEQAEKDNLEIAQELSLDLAQAKVNLFNAEIEFYVTRSKLAGTTPDQQAKARNKAFDLAGKRDELLPTLRDEDRKTSLELFDREVAARTRRTLKEEQLADTLQEQINKAKAAQDLKLTKETGDNPIVQLYRLRFTQLSRQIQAQQDILDNDEKDQKERIAAQNKLDDLQVQVGRENVALKKEINDATKKFADKSRTQQIKVLREQLKTIERSLDFATDRGDQEQVKILMEERVRMYQALRDAEYDQLVARQADAETLSIHQATTAFNIRQMNDLFVKAKNNIKAIEERFSLLEPQPSEQGDFAEAGRKKAVGAPLSEKAQTGILRQRIAVQAGQLQAILDDLERLRKEVNNRKLGITQGTRDSFEAGNIHFPEGTTDTRQEEIEKALKAEQALVREANDLTTNIAEARQELNSMENSVSDAFRTGFNLEDLAARLDNSQSAIKNLGKNIQEELVQGFEGVGDAAAGALVDSESFAEGTRKAMHDMLKQIARDMIKSGVLKMMATMMGGGGGFAASFFAKDGGVVESKAGGGRVGEGGVIKGKGTGSSDSIMGAVTDSKGKVTRGIRVSDGEGIVRSRSMDILGKDFLDMMNTQPMVLANALALAAAAPIRRATGGVIGDIQKTMNTTNISKGNSSGVDYNFSANINVGKDDDSNIPVEVLQQMDQEITHKIGEYVQTQMKPGGLLSAVR